MQTNYSYELTMSRGIMPRGFNPCFTPGDMLRLGVFDGKYMTDCANEYPESMFAQARFSIKKPDPKINAFKKHSGLPLKYWIEQNWINPQDPRGWFEWYCRFWLGRISPDDNRQMERQQKFASRHSALLYSKGFGDPARFQARRQSLLHWSCDPFPEVRGTGETVVEKTYRILNKIRYREEI